MQIVNFGSCNVDHVYKLAHIVQGGETLHSRSAEIFPGGKGLNQSIAVARAGAAIFHAGCVGEDGEILRDVLAESGVGLDYLQTVDAPSGHAIIQVDDGGENAIFIFTGANGCFSIPYIDDTLRHFGKGDLLLLQNEINNNDYIIDCACKKGMSVLLNPSPIDDAIRKVDLHQIAVLLLNRIEGEALSGEKEPSAIIAYFKTNYPTMKTVLTLGSHGCIYYDGAETYYQPAFAVETVDSTAAGDTFTGYFAAGLSLGLPSPVIIERAAAAAALAVSKNGAAPSIPMANEVEKALEWLTLREENAKNPIRQQKECIDEYLTANLAHADLKGLSGVLGYSEGYTGQICKDATGMTFSRYLLKKRCLAAEKLLRESDQPVGEIIEQVGYSNQSYFREAFRQIYGVGPTAFRKLIQRKSQAKGEK